MWNMGNVANILEEFSALDGGSMYFQMIASQPTSTGCKDTRQSSPIRRNV
jgi:hypothetical protein